MAAVVALLAVGLPRLGFVTGQDTMVDPGAEGRRRGLDPRQSVNVGVPRIGRAFVASGLTLVGGFGVLAFSPMPLLRDFGIVVALDVLFALASTLSLLPPLLVWADERHWLRIVHPGAEEAPKVPAEVSGRR
jgi:uncharacterized membrane protein YdfJ with MMPL/SSD domain